MAGNISYKDSGVDIKKADESKKKIKELIASTFTPEVIPDNKGLGAMYAIPKGYTEPILVSGSDGVGTKLKIAFTLDKHDTIGIDLVAMCANDVIRRGAKPLFYMDYIALGKMDIKKVDQIIQGIIQGCRQSSCSLIGGETAQMPDFYSPDEYDLSGVCTGIVEKHKMITGDNIQPGDLIIGLSSTGLHSNGFSLARKIFAEEINRKDEKILSLLLEPTRIYVKPILDILKKHNDITGLAHITGSGFNKLKRLNQDVGFNITTLLPMPEIYHLIKQKSNISKEELFRTFNMGIGFIIIAGSDDCIKSFKEKYGYDAQVIGKIDDSKKVKITGTEI